MTWSRRKRWAVGILVSLGMLAVVCFAYLYENPFWLIDHGTALYLRKNHVQQHDVMVEGHRIHYLEALPSGGGLDKPILLIHGLGARASDWTTLTPTLAEHGYHVYALDLLGYGASDRPADGDFSLAAEERIVAGFLDVLHLQKPDIAGWSMGGWLAAKYALDWPSRVRRLLLFDSAGLYMPLNFSLEVFAPHNRAELDQLMYYIEPNRPHIRIPGVAVEGLLRRFRKNAWIVDNSLSSMLDGREILDFRAHRLKMPVLLLWGTEDKLTPYDTALRFHQLIPHSVLVGIDGCGHLAVAECASQAIPVTLRFLDADPPLGASSVILPAAPR